MQCTYAFLHLCIFTLMHICIFAFCMSALLQFCILHSCNVSESSERKEHERYIIIYKKSSTSSYTKWAVHRQEGTSSYTKHHIRKERYIGRSSTSSYMKRVVHHHIRKERYILTYKRVGKELRDTVGFVSFSKTLVLTAIRISSLPFWMKLW